MYTVKLRGSIFGMKVAKFQLETTECRDAVEAVEMTKIILANRLSSDDMGRLGETMLQIMKSKKFGRYVQVSATPTYVVEVAIFSV